MEESETPAQRSTRNFNELLQELRVAQAGVQILFAFLLAVAFTEQYREGTTYVHAIHMVTVLFTTIAAAFLIAPAVWHRVLFQQGRRIHILALGTKFALIGMASLAAAMTGTVLLISEVVIGGWIALTLAGMTAVMFVSLWFVLPHWLHRDEEPEAST
ncbi:MAG: hypothetical protein GX610_17680 [Rhodococcus sp.]|nr:hypothetical protein [Rhodococcus sp. (in: high G+C Gram-positive bacteria)]